jgi:DNA-binding CsgD family transcriptional regulator
LRDKLDAMGPDPIDTLSDLEKEALRLFLVTSDQKDLARRIDRSPATVEQRLARARRKLGVTRSLDAALLLAEREGNRAYGTAIYGEPLHGPDGRSDLNLWPPKARGGIDAAAVFPTRGRPWNTLPIWLRLALILGGMVSLMVATVAVISIGESLTRIVRQVH